MKLLKKLAKIALTFALLCTGLFMNPLKINAKEVKAGPVTSITETYRYSTQIGGSGTVKLKFNLINYGTGEIAMDHVVGGTCTTSEPNTACKITNERSSGFSSTVSSDSLKVNFNVVISYKGTVTDTIPYVAVYIRNNLKSFGLA